MIHDEKTTEIEIPKTNVTQFRRRASDKNDQKSSSGQGTQGPDRRQAHAPSGTRAATGTLVESVPHHSWLKNLDLTNPWLIRLVAVLIIVGLSLLVI